MLDEIYWTMTSSFVARAEKLISSGEKAHLIYAALEVRMGIEARLQSYVHAHKDISLKIKNGWEISKLSKTLENNGNWVKRVCELDFATERDGESLAKLYFIPVSAELQAIGGQLGDFLHYREGSIKRDAMWWARLEDTLKRGISDLRICARANLLGPPLARKDDASIIDVKTEFHPSDPHHSLLLDLSKKKSQLSFKVNYFSVPQFYQMQHQQHDQADKFSK